MYKFGSPESGIFFGYYGTTFGIIYVPRNVRQLHKITVGTASSDVQSVTVTLGSVAYSVPVTANGSTAATAWEIASFDYTTQFPGWVMSAVGSDVYVGCLQADAIPGTFDISFPTSGAATISQLWAGDASSTSFVPQTSWNIDVLDGSGSVNNPSGSLLDTTKGNLFYVQFQYLGFGFIEFGIEDPATTEMIPVHRIKYANSNILPNFSNPTLPFVVSSRNTTCTSAISLKTASCAGFVQGKIYRLSTVTATNVIKEVVDTTNTYVFSVRSAFVWSGRFNQKSIIPMMINVSNFGANFVQVYVYRYSTLDNNAQFAPIEDWSVAELDTSSTSFSGGQLKVTAGVCSGQDVTIDMDDIDIAVEQNSAITVIAKAVGGTSSISCSFTYAEE